LKERFRVVCARYGVVFERDYRIDDDEDEPVAAAAPIVTPQLSLSL
jgi:hypothetical protein